jgi:hypothetical protein
METGEGGAQNILEGYKQGRVGAESVGGMETGEGGAQNSLEGWKQVRVGLITVWRDGNR